MTSPTTPRQEALAIGITAEVLSSLVQTTGDNDMTVAQILLLLHLRIHGEVHQQEISKHVHVRGTAVSRIIGKLGPGEKPMIKDGPGWVSSEIDQGDRRHRLVRLTPKGRALLDTVSRGAARLIP
jgi:DNA-binding MarR family transcriptional regulator